MPSKVDLVPLNSILPVNLTQSELTESMLVPLVNQFGLMQQQMFDQFQQAMAMMVQMFGTMHRDQMEVIRTELSGSQPDRRDPCSEKRASRANPGKI